MTILTEKSEEKIAKIKKFKNAREPSNEKGLRFRKWNFCNLRNFKKFAKKYFFANFYRIESSLFSESHFSRLKFS